MHNSDYTSSTSSSPYYYYPQQQSANPNPNPNPNPDPIPIDPYTYNHASAPPFSPTPQLSSNYTPYPSFPDQITTYPQQPYSSPPTPPPNSSQYYPPSYSYNHNNTPSQQYPSLANDDYLNLGKRDGDGVYAYKGSNEPYGARGTRGSSNEPYGARGSRTAGGGGGFDDFGRPIGYSTGKDQRNNASSGLKVVKAVPKTTEDDGNAGVHKFRVHLLPETGGQSKMDVICQVGLDGIRMLDPNTNRILRIYLLDAIMRCEAIDSSTFAFWSKSSVDIEPRRIRLQSNRYTTNTLLDTVTAVIVQFKEMGGTSKPYEYPKIAEQPAEKKKGFVPWVNLIKPVNEEKDHWVPDEAATKCTSCGTDFSAFNRKHHCRNCGDIFCDKCTQGRTALTADENAPVVRVCDRCLAEVSRRLSIAKESVNRSTSIQSHEDLAKKLQEEMERSCKVSSGSRSEGSGRRMKEVACPTCTVHLQVQVPSSGSETIECGVCQHPFLVSSH